MSRSLVLVFVLIISGCKSQKVIAVETELSAAKARVVSLEKKRKELLDEAKRAEVSRKTFGAQADAAELARQRLVQAGLVLHGADVPDAVLLETALRTKSPTLGALAATIVQRQLPCVDPSEKTEEVEEEEGDGPGERCEEPELPDACEGVAERTVQALPWSCPSIVKTKGARPVAVCMSDGVWASAEIPLDVPTYDIDTNVLRFAIEHKGRLVVADWPPPSLEIYRPPNTDGLDTCRSENDDTACVRACEKQFGRVEMIGCYDDTYSEGGGDGWEDDSEPAEVAEARRTAEAADAEAARAREELSYQECLARCEPDSTDTTSEFEPRAKARFKLRAERYPAVFAFDVTYSDATTADGGALAPDILVIGFEDALTDVIDPELDENDVVWPTQPLLRVRVMKKYEADGKVTLFGLAAHDGVPAGVTIDPSGKTQPRVFKPFELCAFIPVAKQADIAAWCANPPARLWVPDAGTDAGTDGGAL